jgi:hypothetical protein
MVFLRLEGVGLARDVTVFFFVAHNCEIPLIAKDGIIVLKVVEDFFII